MQKTIMLYTIAALLGVPSAAVAQDLITANDTQKMVAALQAEGMQAKVAIDNMGDPVITSAAGGANFDIYFYDCTKGKDCRSVQFSACFDLKDGITYEAANTWNYDMRYGKASLNEDMDPCLKSDVDMTKGIEAGTFDSVLKVWTQVLGKFVTDIGY